VGVHDDDIVAAIDVRGVVGAMLAAQAQRDEARQAADNDTLGVDDDPLLFDVRRLQRDGGLGIHGVWVRVRREGRAITGPAGRCQSKFRAARARNALSGNGFWGTVA
jgi:hypothetical protein